ncbi:toll/interleukin-1 receptor domain-containing protein [Synechococcus sp. CBW1006]|nr:toll/interleukin-1 receptor domain-containing protein [Synechococcus sp. CBW1006]
MTQDSHISGSSTMAFDVFISYSTCNKLIADAMKQYLQSKGIRCWKAPDDIIHGESWAAAIPRAIKNSQIMVLIWTVDSMNSRQVVNELTLADRAKKMIIPFRTEPIEPENEFEYYLAKTHWFDAFGSSNDEDFELLTERVLRNLNNVTRLLESDLRSVLPQVLDEKLPRRLSYSVQVNNKFRLVLDRDYTSLLDLLPGDQFSMLVEEGAIRLVPLGNDHPENLVTVDSANNIVIPPYVLHLLCCKPGDFFKIMLRRNEIRLANLEFSSSSLEGATKVPLRGSELLAKVQELGDARKSDLVRSCGYVVFTADGKERLNHQAFYAALLEAKGVHFS